MVTDNGSRQTEDEHLLQELQSLLLLVFGLTGSSVILCPAQDPPIIRFNKVLLEDKFLQSVVVCRGVEKLLKNQRLKNCSYIKMDLRQTLGFAVKIGMLHPTSAIGTGVPTRRL